MNKVSNNVVNTIYYTPNEEIMTLSSRMIHTPNNVVTNLKTSLQISP